jgi:predicted O-methyltransferase YrrM
MSPQGTDAYSEIDKLPPLVRRAVCAARRHGFAFSCRPEQGCFLQILAAGAQRRIGETGTGCGVGLAWLATGAADGVRLTSVDRDQARARIAADVFEGCDQVEILHGNWRRIIDHGPYDLLVLDGGGQGEDGDAADPGRMLAPGGVVIIDDFTPATTWPPLFNGEPDMPHLHWLEHPGLHTAELPLAPDLSVIVGTHIPATD